MLEPSFLIIEGNRTQGKRVPCTGSHSYHTPAFPPARRVVLKIRSTWAFLSTAREPMLGALVRRERMSQSSLVTPTLPRPGT